MNSTIDSKSSHWLQKLIENLRLQEHNIRLGGGKLRIEKEHSKGFGK